MKFFGLNLLLNFLADIISAHRPTAIVHGIMFNASDRMEILRDAVRNAQADNIVEVLPVLYDQSSYLPMWYQIARFQIAIVDFNRRNPGGINLIGYSQGGVIARGLIETTKNLTVDSFISISAPQNGFHGEFLVPNSNFSVGNEERFSDSVSGLWKDPRDLVRYKREGRFLACLNNEFKHLLNQQFKDQMCRVKQMILIGGPDDGFIIPWQSALFGYDDAFGRIIDMKNQEVYANDNFCLRTLDNRGAVTRYTVSRVGHIDWHKTRSVIDSYIIPHLA